MSELYIKYIPPDTYTRKDVHPLSRVLFAFIQSMRTHSDSKSTAIIPYEPIKPAVIPQRKKLTIKSPLLSRREFLKLAGLTSLAVATGCTAPSREQEMPHIKTMNWSNKGEEEVIEMMIDALDPEDLEVLYLQACFRWNQGFAQPIGAFGFLAGFIHSIPNYRKGLLEGTLVGIGSWALASCGYGSIPPILGSIAGKISYRSSLITHSSPEAKASGILFGAFTGTATSLPAYLVHLGYLYESRQKGHEWIRAELRKDHKRAIAAMCNIKTEENYFSTFRRHPFTFYDPPNELMTNIETLYCQSKTTEWLHLRLADPNYRHPAFSIDPRRIHFLGLSYERGRPDYRENELAVFFPTQIHFTRDEKGKNLHIIALDAQVITEPTELPSTHPDHKSQVHCENCMIRADFDTKNLKQIEGTNHAFDKFIDAIGISSVAYTENPHSIMLELRRIFELISEERFLDRRVDKFIGGHYVNGTSLSSIEIRYNSDGSYKIELTFDVHMGGRDFTKVKIDSKQFVEHIVYPSQTGIGIWKFVSKDPAFMVGAGAIGLTLLAILGRRVKKAFKK